MSLKKTIVTLLSACALGTTILSCFSIASITQPIKEHMMAVENTPNYEISLMFYSEDVSEGL